MNSKTFRQDLLQGKLVEWTRKTPISDGKIFYEINGQNAFIRRSMLYKKNIADGWSLFMTTLSRENEITRESYGTTIKIIGHFNKKTEDPIQDIMDGIQQIKKAYAVKIFLMQWAIEKCFPEGILTWHPKMGLIKFSDTGTNCGSLNPILNDQLRNIVGDGVLIDIITNTIRPAATFISFKNPSSAHEKIEIIEQNTIEIDNTDPFAIPKIRMK